MFNLQPPRHIPTLPITSVSQFGPCPLLADPDIAICRLSLAPSIVARQAARGELSLSGYAEQGPKRRTHSVAFLRPGRDSACA